MADKDQTGIEIHGQTLWEQLWVSIDHRCSVTRLTGVGIRPIAHHHRPRREKQPGIVTYRCTLPGAQLPPSSLGSIMFDLLVDTYYRLDRRRLWCRVSLSFPVLESL